MKKDKRNQSNTLWALLALAIYLGTMLIDLPYSTGMLTLWVHIAAAGFTTFGIVNRLFSNIFIGIYGLVISLPFFLGLTPGGEAPSSLIVLIAIVLASVALYVIIKNRPAQLSKLALYIFVISATRIVVVPGITSHLLGLIYATAVLGLVVGLIAHYLVMIGKQRFAN